uniref:Putative cytochrome n=1 Tax=Nyssomyia neivai TaxID=330878 RepID=A0A1L8E3Z9_9DIPT
MISYAISFLIGFIFSKWGLALVALGYAAYKWSISGYDTFEKRGLKFIPPVPFFGNFKEVLLQTTTLTDATNDQYNYFPNEKAFGLFQLRQPLIMVRDPELIKQMGVKDFDHFLDHRVNMDEDHEPLFGRNLFSLKGQRWREMRATLSPAFTGSKMRTMFQLVSECCNDILKYLDKEANGRPVPTELKDLFTRVTNDVIATCAFGIKVDSLNNRENEFYLAGKKASDFSGLRSLTFFLLVQFPKLMKFLNMKLFSDKFANFFRSLVWDTINQRERENIIRPDMINLLIQARKGKLRYEEGEAEKDGYATVLETKVGEAIHQSKLQDDDLTAQCLIFFLAGFDTVSTCMCFTGHELAANPDVQKKLIAEVDAVKEQLGGKPLTYEALQNMPYLDMVISESLRFWPPAVATDRQCVKNYSFNTGNGNFEVKVGEGIFIPIVSIHHDPKYFSNPERFDPERFNDENKHSINPFTYMPFGIGPRNCIGSRFALMETKAIIYYILTKFTFEVSSKTQIPLKLAKSGFTLKAEKGFWVDLKPRVF